MSTGMWIAALAGYALLQVLVIAVTLWLAARRLDRKKASNAPPARTVPLEWYATGPLASDAPLWISGHGRQVWVDQQRARRKSRGLS